MELLTVRSCFVMILRKENKIKIQTHVTKIACAKNVFILLKKIIKGFNFQWSDLKNNLSI